MLTLLWLFLRLHLAQMPPDLWGYLCSFFTVWSVSQPACVRGIIHLSENYSSDWVSLPVSSPRAIARQHAIQKRNIRRQNFPLDLVKRLHFLSSSKFAVLHRSPSLNLFSGESTRQEKMARWTYKHGLHWNCEPSNLMRTLCLRGSFSRSTQVTSPGNGMQ